MSDPYRHPPRTEPVRYPDADHDAPHHVSRERFEQLKVEYCERCGLPVHEGRPHLHSEEPGG